MKFDIVTIFPRMLEAFIGNGVIGRAVTDGKLDVSIHDLRTFTSDRHKSVDDVPYGGGPGMVMKAEPFKRAVAMIRRERSNPNVVVMTSPQGRIFNHAEALRLSRLRHVVLLCGRYEGIDERVCKSVNAEEISIGDYVTSGGELPAAVILDAVARLVPGVVGDEASVENDSFARGLLDFPHYTRPQIFETDPVPEILLSGNHAEIRRWRKREAIRRTFKRRPDLLSSATLDKEELEVLQDLQTSGDN